MRWINVIRKGPASQYVNPIFYLFGSIVRAILRMTNIKFTVRKHVGKYGPFKLASEFVFSNFEDWSTAHNRGFNRLVSSAQGKSCVFDIGAHIGLTSLPMSSVISPYGTVYAFEPGKTNVEYLSQHIAANNINNIKVVEAAVGSSSIGKVEFFEHKLASGMNSIIQRKSNDHRKTILVSMISLDHFCLANELRPQLLKIDVEGAEMSVLKGGECIIKKYLPEIFLSVHPRQLKLIGSDVSTLSKYIKRLGYNVYDPESGDLYNGDLAFGEYQLLSR